MITDAIVYQIKDGEEYVITEVIFDKLDNPWIHLKNSKGDATHISLSNLKTYFRK